MEIITSHINADFDALASMVAALRIYPAAVLVFPGSQEKKVRDFIEAFHPAAIKRLKDVELSGVTRMVLVDSKSPGRIGAFAALIGRKGVAVHVYDHHPHEEGDIHGELEVIEPLGATASIMTEVLKARKLQPTPMEATLLALGIYEETGSLLFPTTTERDVNALSYLLKSGASLRIISAFMKTEMGRQELSILNKLLDNSEELSVRGLRIKIARANIENYVGDAAHLAHSIMDMEDIDALVLMLAMEGKVLMIGRSRAVELNIAEALAEFGGGGHWAAASATLTETPFELLEEKLVSVLDRVVRPQTTAADVMTRPVVTADYKATVKRAEAIMTRYGVNVLPVVKEGAYLGVISREVVEKALFHGFGKSRVTDFTTTDVRTVSRETPVNKVESIMVEQNQRFIPVLSGTEIVGAVTRTDILRLLYEDYLRRSRLAGGQVEARQMEKSLAKNLKEKYPEDIIEMLSLCGEVAGALGYGLYMVGGAVRDLVMGKENLDIDLVVEGDAIVFSKELALRHEIKIRSHERFGTAHLIFPGEVHIDVAGARTEHYESPAALPKVESSSIKKDLQRRDFTINTLALKLNPGDFGLLLDFFGARRDIEEKTIRVLHDLSFVEDPTRAFRAVRFAVRFGFKLSRHTEELLKSALRMNLFRKLSGSRLYEELMLIFSETEPVESIKKLSGYGLLKVIHPALRLDGGLLSVLNAAHDSLLWFELSFMEGLPDRPRIYLMALLSGLTEEERGKTLARLDVSLGARRKISEDFADAKKALTARIPPGDTALLYDALHGASLEGLLLAMAATRESERKKQITRYLLELRKLKTELTGSDLIGMGFAPGPAFSRILGELLREKVRGALKSREDEMNYVRTHFSPSTSRMS